MRTDWRAFALVIGFLAAGCADDTEPAAEMLCEQPASSTFDAIQQRVFEGSGCTNAACHAGGDPAGDLDLSAGVAFDNLVGVPSSASPDGSHLRVLPGDQSQSLLFTKLAAATTGQPLPDWAGGPMPFGLPPIAADHLEALRLWIRAGAPRQTVVEGTPELLECGLPARFEPNKIPQPDPPPLGQGVQFPSGPWTVPAASEDEVCFFTWYDLSDDFDVAPEWARVPCTPSLGGPEATCLAYNRNRLTQDPHSHHSIISAYGGGVGPEDPSWGTWQCLGGSDAGTACDPTMVGTPAAQQGGADCAGGGVCGTAPVSRPACVGLGPSDRRRDSVSMGGAQEPVSDLVFEEGVYGVMPLRGLITWNSHGFNLTQQDVTIEQWLNISWAPREVQQHLYRRLFDARHIFAMEVPPFEQQEICASHTLPRGARLMGLGSHVHKRGVRFRTWLPPNEPECSPGSCDPNTTPADYTSLIYDDPTQTAYRPPLVFDHSDERDRTMKFCAVFDNGHDDPATVKRHSTSKGPSRCSAEQTHCIGGPRQGELCGGDHAACDTTAGSGDGDCDACELRGGLTTEDEMFILLGAYYVVEP